MWCCISRLDYGTKYCKGSPTIEESIIKYAILGAVMSAIQTNTIALDILKQHIGMGLTGSDGSEDDQYAIQARIGEITVELDKLYAVQAQNVGEDYGYLFEPLYAERNELNKKLVTVKAAADHASAQQSRLDGIFTVVDGLKNQPLDWDEAIIRQMLECVKVLDAETLGIRFQWGIEMEVPME